MKISSPRYISGLLLAALLLVASGSLAAETFLLSMGPAVKAELDADSLVLWQRINQARSNPRAEIIRLGLSEAEARLALGEDASILDTGLPPLAWQQKMQGAAAGHGRDMIDRLYYSHLSPEGLDPAARLRAVGYPVQAADETLSAMVMDRPMSKTLAIEALIDSILRDELTGTPGVARNIFNSNYRELGIAFFAESPVTLPGTPHLYLLVADFARLQVGSDVLIGRVDKAVTTVLARNQYTGFWSALPLIGGEFFQLKLSGTGEELLFRDQAGSSLGGASSLGLRPGRNHWRDYRSAVPQ